MADGLRDCLLAGEDVEAVQPAEIDVVNVSYTVPGETKKAPPRTVLTDISCKFPVGRLSAIMGASGSGKTSLLTLARGLSSPKSVVKGQVLCNGRPVDVDMMRSISSVVPQEDVFLAALTVREMLGFSAELRLSRKLTASDRGKRVDGVLRLLRLDACADTHIGDERLGVRGISGGERRRLSVGLSIIGGLPQLLLCDEPTSGLDSAAASNMVSILRELAGRGVTTLCAIHQPSFPVFSEFAHLLLLEAGQTVFNGPLPQVEAFFAKHGAPTPPNTNPAHHYIEVIQQQKGVWASNWEASHPKRVANQVAVPAARRSGGSAGKSKLTLWEQTEVLTRRTLKENFKNKKKFFRGVMSRLPASILIGIFFWQMAAVPTQSSIFPLKGVLFLAIQNPMIETFYAGATTFQLTKGLLKREYYDGLYQVAPYYLSYYIGFLAMQIPWTFCWAVPLYLLVGLPLELGRFTVFCAVSFFVILMGCAAGSAVGTFTRDADGNRAVLMPMMIPMVLFSGYVIPYSEIPSIWMPLYYLSPVQWGMTLFETNHYRGLTFTDCDASVPLERRRCFATGDEFLEATTSQLAQKLGISGMMLINVGYLSLFLLMNIRMIRKAVLDGRT